VAKTLTSTREDHVVAWLAALAITIHVAESALPAPLPGVKPGLANVVTLAALLLYGWRAAVWVSALRVLVGSLFIGTFLSPAFFMSFSGAACSIVALGLAALWARWLPRWAPGAVGFAVIAAMAHMLGQFYCAYWLFVPHDALFQLLPVLMTAAMIFGMISGFITETMLRRVERVPAQTV
jgi:heptaprenyl diphosphate synthase